MGIADKAKDFASENKDKAQQGLRQAKDQVKGQASERTEGKRPNRPEEGQERAQDRLNRYDS